MSRLALDRYLDHSGFKTLIQFGNQSIIQLQNLRVISITETDLATYRIQEVTVGTNPRSEYASQLNLDELIEKVIELADSKNTYFITWTVDDVIALNRGLSRNHARLALHTAIDNHDPKVGINNKVITKQCDNVLEMIRNGII